MGQLQETIAIAKLFLAECQKYWPGSWVSEIIFKDEVEDDGHGRLLRRRPDRLQEVDSN